MIEEEPGKQMIEKPRCAVCGHREDVHFEGKCLTYDDRNEAGTQCPCSYYSSVKP